MASSSSSSSSSSSKPALPDNLQQRQPAQSPSSQTAQLPLHLAQRYELQYLIRRFDIQLRYGCTNSNCTARLCLSCRKAHAKPPVRRPSPLTSRIMAFELASGPEPYTKLCPNRPVLLPQQLDLDPRLRPWMIGQKQGSVQVKLILNTWSDGPEHLASADPQLQVKNEATVKDYWSNNVRMAPGTQPDRKSLSQKLFSTAAIKRFLWEPIAEGDMGIMRSVLQPNGSIIRTMSLQLYPPALDCKDPIPQNRSSKKPVRPFSALTVESLARESSSLNKSERNASIHLPKHLEYGLRTPDGLSQSFKSCFAKKDVNTLQYVEAFDAPAVWIALNSAIDALFTPPPNWKTSSQNHPYVKDEDAVHMLQVSIFALIAAVYPKSRKPHHWSWSGTVVASHLTGRSYERAMLKLFEGRGAPKGVLEDTLHTLDAYRNELTLRLATKVIRAIGARRAFAETQPSTKSPREQFTPFLISLFQAFERFERWTNPFDLDSPACGISPVLLFQAWLVYIIKADNSDDTFINRWEPRGAAIEILHDFIIYWEETPNQPVFDYANLASYLEAEMPAFLHNWSGSNRPYPSSLYFLRGFSSMLPTPQKRESKWYLEYAEGKWEHDPNILHILSLPRLFAKTAKIENFRAMNYSQMLAAYRQAGYVDQLSERLYPTPNPAQHRYLHNRLEKAKSRYLLLNVRREHLLEDAFDQLWGREKRELMRPLKIRMGMDWGEAGVDLGGIAQEFFRLVFEKAFDPDAGLFQPTEEKSGCSWFQPNSHEPASTYQLLGVLTALGVYNGLTLPVSFPQVLYDQLVGEKYCDKPTLRFFTDSPDLSPLMHGWTELAKSFLALSKQDETYVESLCLDWTFNYEAAGQRYHIDMYKSASTKDKYGRLTPVPASEETTPVTIHNRTEYMEAYMQWLFRESVRDQLDGFMKGFKAVVDDKALSVMTASTLKDVVEGTSVVDISALARYVTYEGGYDEAHPLITNFWQLINDFPAGKHRALLKFVTATDRLPAQGLSRLPFFIVRSGPDSELLPTSSTCFGKMYIPEYATKEKLREKLERALENSIGFGSA